VATDFCYSFSCSSELITLVIKQGRESHLQGIAQEFINKVEDLQGVQRVTLTVATQLSSKKHR
jgi:F-type H+-transporting ATPase subunit delta